MLLCVQSRQLHNISCAIIIIMLYSQVGTLIGNQCTGSPQMLHIQSILKHICDPQQYNNINYITNYMYKSHYHVQKQYKFIHSKLCNTQHSIACMHAQSVLIMHGMVAFPVNMDTYLMMILHGSNRTVTIPSIHNISTL